MEEKMYDEACMFPRILSARVYNSRNYLTERTVEREVEDFEIGLYMEDSGTLFINGEPHEIRRGSVRFLKPGSRIYTIPHFTSLSMVLRFGEDNRAYCGEFMDEIPQFFYGGEELIPLFTEIIGLYNSGEKGSKIKMNGQILNLLHQLFIKAKKHEKLSAAVLECMEYMKEHYHETVTLETLGTITGYVPLHVLRIFKAQTGKTPHDFLTDIRMEQACALLDSTTFSVARIALLCGFNSTSHFQTLFKNMMGTSPGKYRRNADPYGV